MDKNKEVELFSFNQVGISKWKTENVKNMDFMFHEASRFNNDLSIWDVRKMEGKPEGFDDGAVNWKLPKPIWEVNDGKVGIARWRTSKVLNMEGMFEGAERFNNDLSVWDVHRIPEKPENFDDGADSWELPRPVWGVYDGIIVTELLSAEVIDVTSRINGIKINFKTTNEIGEPIEGFKKEDLDFIFTPSIGEYTSGELIKNGDEFYITVFPDNDYHGMVRLEIKDVASINEANVNYKKTPPRIIDAKRSSLLFNSYDDYDNGITTLTIRLVDVTGKEFEGDYFTKESFKFVDENNNTPIEVLGIKHSTSGQYGVLVKTDLSKALKIKTIVESTTLLDRFTITTNYPSYLVLNIKEYVNESDNNYVILEAEVINVVNGPSTGLILEDFELVQQSNNSEAGVLEIVNFKEHETGIYRFTLTSDKDFKGQLGLNVLDVDMIEDDYIDVNFISSKSKELDYHESKVISGEFYDPDFNAFLVKVLLVDSSGDVYKNINQKDLEFSILSGSGNAVIHDLELVDGFYIIKGIYNKEESIIVSVKVKGKHISDNVLINHPLEVLDTSQVDIIDYNFEPKEDVGRLIVISVTARDINDRYVSGLTKEDFKIKINDIDNLIKVIDVENRSIDGVPFYIVKGLGSSYLVGDIYVYVEDIRSTTSISVEYMPIIQKPINRELSTIISGEYLDEENTDIKLTVLCLDDDNKLVEDLVRSSFKIKNYNADVFISVDKVIFKNNKYELYFTDYGVNDLELEVYVNDVRISKRYLLPYPRPRKKPSKTIASFNNFIVNERSREISILVEVYDDEGKLINDLNDDELVAILVPEQEDITLEITKIEKVTKPIEKKGSYNFIIKASNSFSGKVGFHGEEVTVIIPTDIIDYSPINIVNLEKTTIINGSYDSYNSSIVNMRIKCVDWDNKPIRHLKREDFRIREISMEENLFVISSLETDTPGVYNITFAFNEVRKATFIGFVLDVPTNNTITLEHPIILKTTKKVKMEFLEFVEAGGKRYIDTLVKPLNHLGNVIPDLQKGLFVTYYPVESFEREFDITRFTSMYNDDGDFIGYGIQLFRPTPYKGKVGVSVDSVKADVPIEVNYNPVVEEEEKPEEEEPDRIITIVKKHKVASKGFVKLYTCDTMRNNAIVDISIFSDITDEAKLNSFVNVYLSENPGLRKGDDRYLIHKNIPISDFEISKIIVGSGQSLYLESLTTNTLYVRVSGIEENANFIGKSGLISATTITKAGISEIYRLDYPLATYASLNINIINNTNTDDTITLWIVDNQDLTSIDEEYRLIDKIARQVVKKKTMLTLENITLGPNERIYIHSKTKGVVTNVTGMIITPDY